MIEGTIRTLEEEVRQFAAKRIGEIAQATAAVFGGSVDYEMIWGAPRLSMMTKWQLWLQKRQRLLQAKIM